MPRNQAGGQAKRSVPKREPGHGSDISAITAEIRNGDVDQSKVIPALLSINYYDVELRLEFSEAVAGIDTSRHAWVVPFLIWMLNHGDYPTRLRSLGILGRMLHLREASAALIDALDSEVDQISSMAMSSLAAATPPVRDAAHHIFRKFKERQADSLEQHDSRSLSDMMVRMLEIYAYNENKSIITNEHEEAIRVALECHNNYYDFVIKISELGIKNLPLPENAHELTDASTKGHVDLEKKSADHENLDAATRARQVFTVKLQEATAATAAARHEIAQSLGPALNDYIQTRQHESLAEKKELARWVNDQLEPLGLAVKCPNTGLPGKLRGVAGGFRPGIDGSFCIEVRKDGRWTKTFQSDHLPELALTDSAPLQITERSHQQAVGPRGGRRGRTPA